MTVLAAVLSIIILYFLFALGSKTIKKIVGKKICAICVAVSLTWFSLLVLKWLGFKIDPLVIAILMGQSIVGIMYKLEEYFQKKELRKFWLVRILIIGGGTLLVYWLLNEAYFMVFLCLLVGFFLLAFVWPMILKKDSKKQGGSKAYQKATSGLEKKMEDCC